MEELKLIQRLMLKLETTDFKEYLVKIQVDEIYNLKIVSLIGCIYKMPHLHQRLYAFDVIYKEIITL